MISYNYPNCVSCHVSVQGRGLLKGYGRGIDIDQSYSDYDATGAALGYLIDSKYGDGNWDGYFGNVLADFVVTSRLNREVDTSKTDPTLTALYRQIIFMGAHKEFRINTELGYRDSGLKDLAIGPNLTAVGGETFFLKKLTLDWRIRGDGASGGSEISIGRDYLPIGLQIDDATSYILNLNRNGIYDYPLQAKYFTWTKKWLASAYVYAPTFDEHVSDSREHGGGFMYEYYPVDDLALGVQSVTGFADQADRWRIGAYARWGISRKWTLLAEADYTRFWDLKAAHSDGSQVTTYLQLFYHHTEWLVSSVTGNYAHSDLLKSGEDFVSGRYTLTARITRNLTLGFTFTAGDSRRDLATGQEGAVFASIKF